MRKVIVVPPEIMNPFRISDNRRLLYQQIGAQLGFELIVTDVVSDNIIENADVVMLDIRKYLRKSTIKTTAHLGDMPISKKLIVYALDIELPSKDNKHYDRHEYAATQRAIYQRADLILGDMYEYFWEHFVDCADVLFPKYIWFPKAVVAVERYARLKQHHNRINKCVVAGKLKKEYPLRKMLVNGCSEHIVYLAHPGYETIDPKHYIIGDRFAEYLNSHMCAFCGSKVTRYLLEKYMLIPAAWCLLIGRQIPDLDRAGFVPNVHYVPVDGTNVCEMVGDILARPQEAHTPMITNARKLVMTNHTIKNRIDTLFAALERIKAL